MMQDYMPSDKELSLLNSIYPLEDSVLEKLSTYHRILVQWQKKTNLVAPSTLQFFWQRHVADSLQILALYPKIKYWTDIGSGGGFPGLILAIILGHQYLEPDSCNVNLVESIQKKCVFLRKVANETNAAAKIHVKRIESASKQFEEAEAVSARALASLEKLLNLTEGHIIGPRFAAFHKGRDYQREIEECNGKWNFDLVVHKSKIDVESVILEVRNAVRI
ncbi:MAG: 16S rRNA (guanine(527)-N(7))-methyltransferase RsmG [Hyphomicrobiales bacterium]|nr:MAG: 16S rRNA (guanine(527)-N(7))-methyltransferase RsmG [Hyphomicrobiales bacterium]